jgi:hypothetical protein
MKGLMEQSDSNAVFLSIKHHGIVQESKTPKDGFKPIEVKNPRTNETFTKYIKRYNGIEALVNKIEWRDTGDQYDQRYMGFKIYLDADGVPCVLDLPFESRQCTRFMKLAENIDFSQPVIFRAWHDTKDDKTAFFVGQGWEGDKAISVPQKYTRDDPGECPPPVQKFNGKWNFDDQTQFLYERMVNVVIPAVEAAASMRQAEPIGASNGELPPDQSEPEYVDDDIPF